MNRHFQKAFAAMKAAKPASGLRPESEAEWVALQGAQEEMGYAWFRSEGKSDAKARAMAKAIYGGTAGRILLDIAFPEKPHA